MHGKLNKGGNIDVADYAVRRNLQRAGQRDGSLASKMAIDLTASPEQLAFGR
jgi:hypothetical protein